MARDARDKLLVLIRRANSPTDDADQEARTAAVQACKLIAKHPELVAGQAATTAQPQEEPHAEASTVHPDAERLREWRAMLERKSLREGHAARPSLCADCGTPIAAGEPVVERPHDDLATHLACAAWWWNFEAPHGAGLDLAS